jgi:hypothetical protein
MGKRTVLILLGALGLIAIIAVGWYLGAPLIIDDSVDEAFPFDAPSEAQIEDMSDAERSELEADFMAAMPSPTQVSSLSPQDQEAVTDKVMGAAATVMMDKPMDDDMMGDAAIFQKGDQRVLRFEDFSVTNGPDLHVILTKHSAPSSRSDVGEDYIDLGSLKGNLGNQNYEIPADVGLSAYKGVVIYCVPFHIIFATATLS